MKVRELREKLLEIPNQEAQVNVNYIKGKKSNKIELSTFPFYSWDLESPSCHVIRVSFLARDVDLEEWHDIAEWFEKYLKKEAMMIDQD